VDPDRVAQVVSDHPVRCAILYGSQVTGTATAKSDVDIAVAFEEGVSAADRLDRRLDLIVDLVEALGTDDVDVADLDSIRPSVGLSALQTGRVLLGDEAVLEDYRERFRTAALPSDELREERLRRFDAVLARLEDRV
jgi:predicted nucleotidyltransferase